MRLPDDDELYEVDQTYLGPPGRYIGQFRHKAIFAWLILGPLMFVVMRQIHFPMTLLTVGLMLIGSVAAAGFVANHVTPEKPISSGLLGFWHDLTTPRPPKIVAGEIGDTFDRVVHPQGVWARALARRAVRTSAPIEEPPEPSVDDSQPVAGRNE